MSFTHKITYDTASHFVFDADLVEVSGGLIRLKDLGGATYSTANPTVTTQNTFKVSALATFVETKSVAGSDQVKYTLVVDGVEKYWTGTAWATSDGTYSQSNLASEINTNAPTLSTGYANVRVKAFLHSESGTTRPTLTDNTIGFNYVAEDADAISECTITAFLADLGLDLLSTDLEPKLFVKNHRAFTHGNRVIAPFTRSASFDADGYCELDCIETETVGEELDIFITYKEGYSLRTVRFERAVVPNEASATLGDISVVRVADFG
jgi:hypothetical protein